MEKKYELTETVYRNFYRIKALKDFQLITGEMVKKGDLGGLVDGEHNLSQEGNCWIGYNTVVYDNSIVSGNAVMQDNSIVCGNSIVSGNAVMKDNSWAYDNSTVSGNAVMQDNSVVCGNSIVSGNAIMKDYSCADGDSIITVTTDLLGTN